MNMQRRIVADLRSERALVESNRKLVEIFERKIQAKLASLWGEDSQPEQPKTKSRTS
jgi:hypothetical protein